MSARAQFLDAMCDDIQARGDAAPRFATRRVGLVLAFSFAERISACTKWLSVTMEN
jgi:hypothetical protein